MWRLRNACGRSSREFRTLVAGARLCVHSAFKRTPRPLYLSSPRLRKLQFSAITNTTPPPEPTLRWGIAPVNFMADDFATALSVLPADQHRITSCMDAYRSQALSFADKHHVPNVFTSFEELARCPDVDAVYIAPLNPMHCELCHLMLNHDKHVLCEQPLCMNEHQVVEVVDKARSRGLFLMEGIWSRCMPAYHFLRREIERCQLGKIYDMECSLGWRLPIAQAKPTPYAGVTKDLGPYGIQLALWVYREVPRRLKVTGKINSQGVDVATDIYMVFKGNRRAHLLLSAEENLSNTATIHGTKGSVTLNNTWCPTSLNFESSDVEFQLPTVKQPTHYDSRIGMCYEAAEMRNCILDGCTESKFYSHNESRLMANLTSQIKDMLDEDCHEVDVQQRQAVS